MNIGLLLPITKKWWRPFSINTHRIETIKGLNFVVCLLPSNNIKDYSQPNYIKRNKPKLDRLFEEQSIWPILEHPKLLGLYQTDLSFIKKVTQRVVIARFYEVLKNLKGIGRLNNIEILITGLPQYLEMAIAVLITKVKTINILIPEGIEEPMEAERAFSETGIPVHITNDVDVIKRNRVWLRFPQDDHSFDILPQKFNGIIIDFEALELIDTRLEKIYNINIKFSELIKRKLGRKLLNTWEKGVLEGFVITMYACFNDINEIEASISLCTRITFTT